MISKWRILTTSWLLLLASVAIPAGCSHRFQSASKQPQYQSPAQKEAAAFDHLLVTSRRSDGLIPLSELQKIENQRKSLRLHDPALHTDLDKKIRKEEKHTQQAIKDRIESLNLMNSPEDMVEGFRDLRRLVSPDRKQVIHTLALELFEMAAYLTKRGGEADLRGELTEVTEYFDQARHLRKVFGNEALPSEEEKPFMETLATTVESLCGSESKISFSITPFLPSG